MKLNVFSLTSLFLVVASCHALDVDKLKDSIGHTSHFYKTLSQASDVFKEQHAHPRKQQLNRGLEGESWDEGGVDCGTCQAELAVCKENEERPSYLMVQMANVCTLARNENGVYTLSSSDMHNETWWFSDRPYALALETNTTQFFDEFELIFDEESGGKPNAAFTFVHQDSKELNGPIVSILISAAYSEMDPATGELTFTYELDQSLEQEAINPLSAFFTDEGGDETPETFQDCSIFIDNVWSTPHPTCECNTRNSAYSVVCRDSPGAGYVYQCNDENGNMKGCNIDASDYSFEADDHNWISWDFKSDDQRIEVAQKFDCADMTFKGTYKAF